jgi:hypothetical protein
VGGWVRGREDKVTFLLHQLQTLAPNPSSQPLIVIRASPFSSNLVAEDGVGAHIKIVNI